jgi:hypothetical protein
MANPTHDSEAERSRAAVAVACLEWLRCTGPVIHLGPSRNTSPLVAELLDDTSLDECPVAHLDPPHPLWDRWIDG